MKIMIIGAGPTGLGAAHRLAELGHEDWTLLETTPVAGGLAASFTDENGFIWDIGGHVQFSHYEYFDRVMLDLLGADQWLHHERESWVWLRDRFVPYPFQNNIRRLPKEDLVKCLSGLVSLYKSPHSKPKNFREWMLASFGEGIADVFLLPYNFKVWAMPPETMGYGWVGERVAVPDLERILTNIVYEKDDVSWGPNSTFQFPKQGGTGEIWRTCASRLPQERLWMGRSVTEIDAKQKVVTLQTGERLCYDALVTTAPLLETLKLAKQPELLRVAEEGLAFSSSNIIGVGLRGKPPEALAKKCWMYFPEADCPFYRVTVFSNYSPNNVPNITKFWSLMTETSESVHKPVNQEQLVEETIQGLLNTRLVESRDDIVSTWTYRAHYGYPTPSLHRDRALAAVQPELEKMGIFSRGRFGAWKYEVSNQDHSFMQGVEIAERLLHGRREMTLNDPNYVNGSKQPFPYPQWEM